MKSCLIILALFIISISATAFACIQQVPPSHETLTLQKGTFTFPDNGKRDEEYDCKNKICTCQADIRYVRFDANSNYPKLQIINNSLKKRAEDMRCNADMGDVSALPKVTHDSSSFISVVITGYGRVQGGNGSCHGANEVRTFKVDTGEEYYIKNIVDASKIEDIKEALIQNTAKTILADKDMNYDGRNLPEITNDVKKELNQSITDKELSKLGFYIDGGKVMINTNLYFTSCAGGNFFPVELPERFITDRDLIEELHHEKIQSLSCR